jgi:hypothetical protein
MTASPAKPAWTDSGIPVESDKDSLTVGPDPPILRQDHYPTAALGVRLTLRYPFAIPFGHLLDASGYSEVTGDASAKAVVFQPGTRTDANAESRSALARLAGGTGLRDGPFRIDRQLRRCFQSAQRDRPRHGHPFCGWEPDHRRGPALGNDGSRLEHRADPPAGLRGTPGFLHRACGDGDRECRKPRRAESLEGPDHHRYTARR